MKEKEITLKINISNNRIESHEFIPNDWINDKQRNTYLSASSVALLIHQSGSLLPQYSMLIISDLIKYFRSGQIIILPINPSLKGIAIDFLLLGYDQRIINVYPNRKLICDDNSVEEGIRQALIAWFIYVLSRSSIEYQRGIWVSVTQFIEAYLIFLKNKLKQSEGKSIIHRTKWDVEYISQSKNNQIIMFSTFGTYSDDAKNLETNQPINEYLHMKMQDLEKIFIEVEKLMQ